MELSALCLNNTYYIFAVQAKADSAMGNDQARMQTPSIGVPPDQNAQLVGNTQPSASHVNNNIPGNVTLFMPK